METRYAGNTTLEAVAPDRSEPTARTRGTMLISDDGPQPHCHAETELFFGPEDDGRDEVGRTDREDLCKTICLQCPLRLKCLEESLVNKERYGVWGGMGEGERKRFVQHLLSEGYNHGEVPHGIELYASAKSFYRSEADANLIIVLRAQSA